MVSVNEGKTVNQRLPWLIQIICPNDIAFQAGKQEACSEVTALVPVVEKSVKELKPDWKLYRWKNIINIVTFNIINRVNQLSEQKTSAAKHNKNIIQEHRYYHSELEKNITRVHVCVCVCVCVCVYIYIRMEVNNGNESDNREKLKNKVIQREEFNVKESQHYNASVLMNYHQDLERLIMSDIKSNTKRGENYI